MVESRLEVFAPAAATAPAPPPPSFGPVLAALAVGGAPAILVVAVLGLVLPGLVDRGGLDLGLDLVAEIDFAGPGLLVVPGEAVPLVELAQL